METATKCEENQLEESTNQTSKQSEVIKEVNPPSFRYLGISIPQY